MNILIAIGRSDLFLKVDLSKYPMIIAAFFIGISYGIEGVAWSMVFTSFISFFINAYFPGKMFGFGGIAQLKVAYKYIISAVVMYTGVNTLSFDGHLWLILIAKIALGAVIYPVSLILIRDKFLLANIKPLVNKIQLKLAK